MTALARLKTSIGSMYEVFSCYEQPTYIVAAMGDIDETNDPCGLLSTPLRELTAKNLLDYSGSAIYTDGSVTDFKFYLPRILELLATEGDSHLDAAIIFTKLPDERPLLFRFGGLQPMGTHGRLTKAGDIQVCKYPHGWVTKKLRTKEYGREIVFDVIEQEIGFERSVRLLSGSFQLEALGPTTTRLTLRTDYEALLRPRACWAPFENYILHTLHEYILDGIEREALASAHRSPTPGRLAYDVR